MTTYNVVCRQNRDYDYDSRITQHRYKTLQIKNNIEFLLNRKLKSRLKKIVYSELYHVTSYRTVGLMWNHKVGLYDTLAGILILDTNKNFYQKHKHMLTVDANIWDLVYYYLHKVRICIWLISLFNSVSVSTSTQKLFVNDFSWTL